MRLTSDHPCKRVIGCYQHRLQIIAFVTLLVVTVVVPAVAQKPQAALPRVFIDTTFNPPLGGTTRAAHTAAQFSSALTSAAPGDIIILDAGTVYTGNFVVPAKPNPNREWIYIESSALPNLPPAGTRLATRCKQHAEDRYSKRISGDSL